MRIIHVTSESYVATIKRIQIQKSIDLQLYVIHIELQLVAALPLEE